jgi:hypothetical protein
LLSAPSVKALSEGIVAQGKDRGGEKSRINGSSLTNRKGANRDAARHLDD